MGYTQNESRGKGTMIFHSQLVKSGPTLVRVKSAPRWVKDGKMCVVTVEKDGEEAGIHIASAKIESDFKEHVGKAVVLVASGSDRDDSAEIEFQAASASASGGQTRPSGGFSKPTRPPSRNSSSMKDAKIWFHQAANLMRISIKKANDIAQELDLPKEHRQGIGTTLFIQAERQGFLTSMPVDPISPQELGWATSGNEPNEPDQDPENDDGPDIPF